MPVSKDITIFKCMICGRYQKAWGSLYTDEEARECERECQRLKATKERQQLCSHIYKYTDDFDEYDNRCCLMRHCGICGKFDELHLKDCKLTDGLLEQIFITNFREK